MTGLDRYLAPQMSDFGPVLLSPHARDALLAFTAGIPGPFAFSGVAFEADLLDPEGRMDLLLAAGSESHGRRLLKELAAAPERRNVGQWRRIASVADRWADRSDALHDGIDDLWLEFDTAREPFPLPCLFAGPVWRLGGVRRPREQIVALIRTYVHTLWAGDLPPDLADNLNTAVLAMPRRALMFQVGVMTSRPTGRVRLCLIELTPDDIVDYLRRLGHPDPAVVGEAAAWAGRHARTVALAIDLGRDVAPRVGLECYFGDHRKPDRPARAAALLRDLTICGAALAGKSEAVLKFPGYRSVDPCDDIWPREHRALSSLIGRQRRSVFTRQLHHVKLTVGTGEAWRAKAYLGVVQRWIA